MIVANFLIKLERGGKKLKINSLGVLMSLKTIIWVGLLFVCFKSICFIWESLSLFLIYLNKKILQIY